MTVTFLEDEATPAKPKVTFLGDDTSFYSENTGRTVTAPDGIGGKAVTYLDSTQNQGKKSNEHFGFVHTPISFITNSATQNNLKKFTQGAIKGVINSGLSLATADAATMEKRLGRVRELRAGDSLDWREKLKDTAIDVTGLPKLNLEEQEAKILSRIKDIKKIRTDIPNVLEGMGLDPNDESFAGKLGAGGPSLGIAIALKNPIIVGSILGTQTYSNTYNEAREVGLGIGEAQKAAFIDAGGVATIEAIGTSALFSILKDANVFSRAVKGFLQQGSEEFSQEVYSILVKNEFDITDTGFDEGLAQALESFLIGGLWGAPVSAMINQSPQTLQQIANDLGVSKEEAQILIDWSEGLADLPQVQQEYTQALDSAIHDEFSPLKDDAESRGKVEDIIANFYEGVSVTKEERNAISEYLERKQIQFEAQVQEKYIEQANDIKNQFERSQKLDPNKPTSFRKAMGYTPESIVQFIKRNGGIEFNGELKARDITTKSMVGLIRKAKSVDSEQISMLGKDAEKLPDQLDFLKEKLFLEGYFPNKDNYDQIEDSEIYDAIAEELAGNKVYNQEDTAKIVELTDFNVVDDYDQSGIDPSMSEIEIANRLREIDGLLPYIPPSREQLQDPPPQEFAERVGDTEPKPLPEAIVSDEDVMGDVEYVKAKRQGFVSGKIIGPVKGFFGDMLEGLDKFVGSSSTRVKTVDVRLMYRLRAFENSTKQNIVQDHRAIEPFLRAIKTLDLDTFIALDLAMKNGNNKVIDQIAKTNGIENEINAVRGVLDNIYQNALAVGMNVNYRAEFFPRAVKDLAGLMDHLRQSEYWSTITEAVKAKEGKLGRDLKEEEKITVINTLLRGYSVDGISLSLKGQFKDRTIRKINKEINEFYEDTDQALLKYIHVANEAIETSKLFGRGQSINGSSNIKDSIGAYVNDMLVKGDINFKQAKVIQDILNARFNEGRMSGIMAGVRDLSYIDVMGSPLNALTQIGDLTTSIYNSGLINTLITLPKAITNRVEVTMDDLGLDNISIEFDNGNFTSRAVDRVFTATGLKKIDKIGKLTLVNSALRKFRKQAKSNNARLIRKLSDMFGQDASTVLEDLKNKNMTPDVQLLVFNTLLDFQPMARSEMPEYYLRAGNGKIFYMLKSFTIKQLDMYRREVYMEFKDGVVNNDKAQIVGSLRNLMYLAGLWTAMGASADWIKDYVRSFFGGDEFDEPESYVIDNILKAFGFSKYQKEMITKKGPVEVAWDIVQPPAKFLGNIYKDFDKFNKEGLNLENSRGIRTIPVGGELYYFWFGAGTVSNKKINSKKRRSYNKKTKKQKSKGMAKYQ